ncbi:hypothetical protein E0L36_13450 [Streptomyces sp. AJS327]|uniref:hypothetical protein n=1 Tax=Streptomyces sp. AJS327 TaxID=2545265 RepID=UPI0015E04559|nr:hypothetical protein [Streptomyces sp. AJS327]MBA0051865.1 hypothetical protein [Streptomyces sp. AJS327]
MSLTPSPATARPPRRSLLTGALGAAAGAAVVSGCSGGDTEDSERAAAARELRTAEARRSERLLASYESTIAAHEGLADRLRPLRRTVAQHARVLRGGTPGHESSSPSPTSRGGDGEPGAGPAARSREVPGDRADALRALASAERRAADRRTAALATAPPELARLLASLAAAGATHVYLLGKDAA